MTGGDSIQVIAVDGRYEEEVHHNYLSDPDILPVPKIKLLVEIDSTMAQAIMAALDESLRSPEGHSQGVQVTFSIDTYRHFWPQNPYHPAHYSESINAIAWKLDTYNYELIQYDVRETAPDEWVMWERRTFSYLGEGTYRFSSSWKAHHTTGCGVCSRQTAGPDPINGYLCSDCIMTSIQVEKMAELEVAMIESEVPFLQ